MDRRNFLRMGFAGLALPAFGSVLAACTTPGVESPGEEAQKNLIVASTRGGVNLDPDTVAGAPATTLWLNVYDPLVDTGLPADGSGDGAPAPGLAVSWSSDDERRVWTFELQPDCASPAGNELSADDVVWSVARNIAMGGTPKFFLGLAGITDASQVVAVGEKTVEYTLANPAPGYFLQLLGAPWMVIYDSLEAQQHVVEDDWAAEWLKTNAAGFGPFSITRRASDGSQLNFAANPGHWAPPAVDTITWTVVEPASSIQLLERGEISVSHGYSAEQLQTVAAGASTKVAEIATAGSVFFGIRNTIPPFDDKEFRQGIAYALPFADMVASAYGTYAQPWRSQLIPFFTGVSEDHWVYGENAEPAPQLEPYAGTTITLSYAAGNAAHEAVAVLAQAALNDAGLDAQISAMEQSTYDSERLAGNLAFYIDDADSPAVASPLYQLKQLYATTPIQALFAYSNPDIDALIEQLDTASDDQVAGLVDQAVAILADDMPTIPLAWTRFQVPAREEVEGFRSHVMNLLFAKELSL